MTNQSEQAKGLETVEDAAIRIIQKQRGQPFHSEIECFKLGSQWQQSQPGIKQWVSVEDRLPEGQVLLLTSSMMIIIGDLYKGVWRSAGHNHWVDDHDNKPYQKLASNLNIEDITHWMPLPTIPKDL